MKTTFQPTDDELLAALAERLTERRGALQQAAQVLGDMRAVNAKLETAERLKGRFLSNIRNEINNPLTTVRGFAAALANTRDLAPDRVAGMAATIFREVSDLSFQMQNIFAAADLEAGVAAPDFARVNLPHLVQEVAADFAALADFKNVKIEIEAADGMLAMTDPGKLSLILANLVRNAVEFARTAVNVRLTLVEESLTIDVRDDGPGISEAGAERIFDRFVQLSEGSTKEHPGHGLGLSVARACAELIGGQVAVIPAASGGAHLRVSILVGALEAGGEDADAANQFLFDAVDDAVETF